MLFRDRTRAKAVGPGLFVDGGRHGLFHSRVTGPAAEPGPQLGALAGRSQFEVASGITGSASPYAKEKVWRPASARNGKWTLEAGQDAGSMRYEGMRLENMPDQLKDQLDQELAKM